ncbi:hypothetical protein [Brachybacterium alimentarium]
MAPRTDPWPACIPAIALPTILLFSLLQRRLVAGMTAGAVKE